MCQLFVKADANLWESHTRSLRIAGVVTSIRLEQYFWNVLQEVAYRDQMNVNQLITKLYLESLDADHDIGNFTSFLRVCCARYLSLMADGYVERQPNSSLSALESKTIMDKEKEDTQLRKLTFSNIRNEQH
ncbi:ribbon-helix-helix domain-containing protein [Pseudoalteromonas xiamenensis]|uniref:Ribbon-helix-helix domain-containing protein n=1 Tax=Pseudoalteromonas xiamenensis TaxID=882626 RepID=A0A975HMN0_9GAMM|nr:ribbon-helix-helix domain-containing protein [Pseudoalteromonas xiamenensis]QTH71275.1 ribbon-helix-helix domain-containing protein [Pseudoalteromonas xiamenensis]